MKVVITVSDTPDGQVDLSCEPTLPASDEPVELSRLVAGWMIYCATLLNNNPVARINELGKARPAAIRTPPDPI